MSLILVQIFFRENAIILVLMNDFARTKIQSFSYCLSGNLLHFVCNILVLFFKASMSGGHCRYFKKTLVFLSVTFSFSILKSVNPSSLNNSIMAGSEILISEQIRFVMQDLMQSMQFKVINQFTG